MKVFFKTLFGDLKTIFAVGVCVAVSVGILFTPYREVSGYFLPLSLLLGAAWLARS